MRSRPAQLTPSIGRFRHEREGGSMPLALLAVIIVAGLVTVLFARTGSSQRNVRFDRDFTEALHAADGGLQEVYHQLNTGRYDADAINTTRTGTGSVDGIPYSWEAEKTSHRAWEVRSTGTAPDADRTVVATVQERPRFFPGGFGDNLVALNGTSSWVDSYNSTSTTCPTAAGTPECWGGSLDKKVNPHGTGNGSLGTNNTFDFSGNTSVKTVFLYDWENNPGQNTTATDPGGDRCNGESSGSPCIDPDAVRLVDPRLDYASDEEMQFIFDKLDTSDCASQSSPRWQGDWKLGDKKGPPQMLAPFSTSGGDNQGAPWEASHDNFYCANSLEIFGDVELDSSATLDEPVVIYVKDYVKVSNNGTKVNCVGCDRNNPRGTSASDPTLPKSQRLYIFTASDPTKGGGDVILQQQSMYAGILWAPRARCDGSGGGVHVYGNLICGSIDNVGNWEFHFDDALARFGTGVFDVALWTEAE